MENLIDKDGLTKFFVIECEYVVKQTKKNYWICGDTAIYIEYRDIYNEYSKEMEYHQARSLCIKHTLISAKERNIEIKEVK